MTVERLICHWSTTKIHSSSSHPDAVLGYYQNVENPPPGQIGGSTTVTTERRIGFYNSSGSLTGDKGIKFDNFKAAVKK